MRNKEGVKDAELKESQKEWYEEHATVKTDHEVVGVIVWCGTASCCSCKDSAPVTGPQLH